MSQEKDKSSFIPFVIAAGAALAFLGIAIFIPLFIVGLIVVLLAVAKLFVDGRKERFAAPDDATEETWPLRLGKEKLGIWVFIMSEILIFGSLIVSYVYVRLSSPNWPIATQIHDPIVGMVNTIILLTSSLTVILALYYVRVGNPKGLKIGLVSTLVLGLSFLIIKLGFEWPSLVSNGFTISSGLPASSYYVLTGVHAVHVAAGLVAVGYLLLRSFASEFTVNKHSGVEFVGVYWHFVDIVWMFLFPLFYLI